MRVLYRIQQVFHLTRTEALTVLFLTGLFVGGMGVQYYRLHHASPASFTYAHLDSLFRQAAAYQDTSMVRTDSTRTDSLPATPAPMPPASQKKKVNINTADREALIALPGIGPRLAERILQYRMQHGAFMRVEDLMRVRGIGPRKLERLRPLVSVQ